MVSLGMKKISSKIKNVHIGRVVDNLHDEIHFWNTKLYPNSPIYFYDIMDMYVKKYDPDIVISAKSFKNK